ncbi:hypothetical protein [Mycolicibacterium pulveris]|uniref:hypothetical protein n=1 Tax=Mycolicibacterium pulveris TaxID=36813 RepID=UPI003CE97817
MIETLALRTEETPTWWVNPVIGGCFVLLGAAITLTVNFLVQKRRDERGARRKEFEMARDWVENALAVGGAVYRWVQKQETLSLRSPIREVPRESHALIDRMSGVGETLDLFVPKTIQPSAKDFCLQAFLLCMPVWNENGYAAQKNAYLAARSKLIGELRRFGGLEVVTTDRVEVPTHAQARDAVIGPLLPGLRAHLEFRGLSAEDIEEALRHLIAPAEAPQPDESAGSG